MYYVYLDGGDTLTAFKGFRSEEEANEWADSLTNLMIDGDIDYNSIYVEYHDESCYGLCGVDSFYEVG